MNQIPMTLRGAERLREELNELKTSSSSSILFNGVILTGDCRKKRSATH
jgi:hypothetical protein